MNKNHPLVSIIVITYNSSKTIIDTLDSIKEQTYNNIELIISDDNSQDNTIHLCKNWILNNKTHFENISIITSDINTGPAPNLNRGLKKASGEWIKSIAGDDILYPNSISQYVKYSTNCNCKISFAKMKPFGSNESILNKTNKDLSNIYEKLNKGTREEQFETALNGHILPGPGIFYQKDFVLSIGCFNEKYPFTEEEDFELRVFQKEKVLFINEYLVGWRISPTSLCHSLNPRLINYQKKVFYDVRKPLMLKHQMYLKVWDDIIYYSLYCPLFLRGIPRYICKCVFILSPIRYKIK